MKRKKKNSSTFLSGLPYVLHQVETEYKKVYWNSAMGPGYCSELVNENAAHLMLNFYQDVCMSVCCKFHLPLYTSIWSLIDEVIYGISFLQKTFNVTGGWDHAYEAEFESSGDYWNLKWNKVVTQLCILVSDPAINTALWIEKIMN